MRLFEAKKLGTNGANNNAVREVICDTLCMISQVHLWHWQTKSYAAHMALGDYYAFLQTNVDLVAESFMGIGNDISVSGNKSIEDFKSIDEIISKIKEFNTNLKAVQSTLMGSSGGEMDTVADLILAICSETDKLLFLLTLD
jgi:DNA-binding ferritin-like protein